MRAEDRGNFRGNTLLAEALAEAYGDGRLGISPVSAVGYFFLFWPSEILFLEYGKKVLFLEYGKKVSPVRILMA